MSSYVLTSFNVNGKWKHHFNFIKCNSLDDQLVVTSSLSFSEALALEFSLATFSSIACKLKLHCTSFFDFSAISSLYVKKIKEKLKPEIQVKFFHNLTRIIFMEEVVIIQSKSL